MAREDTPTARVTVEKYTPDTTTTRSAIPWWLVSAGGAMICAIAGWAVITALVLTAQLAQTGVAEASALVLSTQVWLLTHGGVLHWAGATISMVPLGFTALVALMLHGVATHAGKQFVLSKGTQFNRGYAVLKIVAVLGGTYTIIVCVAGALVDPMGSILRTGFGGLALSVVLGFFAARKAVKWDIYLKWPVWAQAVPKAIISAVLVAMIGGTVALVAGLIKHRDLAVSITNQLDPGWVGGIVLVFIQFFFVANLIIWAMSWTLGPGFTVGDGSVISLVDNQVGLLPVLPITAAIPSGLPSIWTLFWLVVPVIAGGTAAIVILRARPRARFDETALVGGLAGLLSGLVITGFAALSRGSLGILRLTGMGPLLVQLLVFAPCIMGLGGMITGLVVGLIRRPTEKFDPRWWSRWNTSDDSKPHPHEPSEPTSPIHHRPTIEEQPPLDFFPE